MPKSKKRDWGSLYATYRKRYTSEFIKATVPMSPPLSLVAFQTTYSALENDRRLEIQRGDRKVLNITQDLVRAQKLYARSLKQAKAAKKSLAEWTGINYTIKEIREGKAEHAEEFWALISEYYNEWKENKESMATVGQLFFGSPQ